MATFSNAYGTCDLFQSWKPPIINKLWVVYIDANIYYTFQNNKQNIHSLQYTSKMIYFSSMDFVTKTEKNFMKKIIVKSIVGTLKCCFLSSSSTLIIKKNWIFKSSPSLGFNLTVLYIKFQKEDNGEMLKIAYNSTRFFKGIVYFTDRYSNNYEDRQYYVNYYKGRRHHFNVYLPKEFKLTSWTYLSLEAKYDIKFSVMALPHCVASFTKIISYFIWMTGQEVKLPQHLDFIGCFRHIIYSHVLITSKMYQLILILSDHNYLESVIKIFDGPDNRNKLIEYRKKSVIIMSTFQCYIEFNFINNKMENYVSYKKQLFQFIKKYNLNATQPLLITQNICQTNHLIYCVLNISTETGYPNISVTKMVYFGPDYKKCMSGGVSIGYGNIHETLTEKTMCDNYTKKIHKTIHLIRYQWIM